MCLKSFRAYFLKSGLCLKSFISFNIFLFICFCYTQSGLFIIFFAAFVYLPFFLSRLMRTGHKNAIFSYSFLIFIILIEYNPVYKTAYFSFNVFSKYSDLFFINCLNLSN